MSSAGGGGESSEWLWRSFWWASSPPPSQATLPTFPPKGSFKTVNQIAPPLLETLPSLSFTQKIQPQVLPMSFEFLVICPLAPPSCMTLHVLQPPRPSQTRPTPLLWAVTGGSSDVLCPRLIQAAAPSLPAHTSLPRPPSSHQYLHHTLSPVLAVPLQGHLHSI